MNDKMISFFFQAEDGIRDAQESRGLGDVYKRQGFNISGGYLVAAGSAGMAQAPGESSSQYSLLLNLSLIHI